MNALTRINMPPAIARQAGTAATGLGIVSIGLGVTELLMPRMMSRTVGLQRDQTLLIRLHGLREIACGIGILTARRKTPWVWARVGGDVIDAATLELHGADRGSAGRRNRLAMAAAAAISVADVATAATLSTAAPEPSRTRGPLPDYSQRSGFPKPADEMRGAARADFDVPRDMRAEPTVRQREPVAAL